MCCKKQQPKELFNTQHNLNMYLVEYTRLYLYFTWNYSIAEISWPSIIQNTEDLCLKV